MSDTPEQVSDTQPQNEPVISSNGDFSDAAKKMIREHIGNQPKGLLKRFGDRLQTQ